MKTIKKFRKPRHKGVVKIVEILIDHRPIVKVVIDYNGKRTWPVKLTDGQIIYSQPVPNYIKDLTAKAFKYKEYIL